MKNKILIFIEFPLTKRDFYRFGINQLSNLFQIVIIDFTYFNNVVFKDKKYKEYNPNNIEYTKLNNFFEYLSILKKNKNIKCIDFLNDNIRNKILRFVSSIYKLKLIRTSHGVIPIDERSNKIKVFLRKLFYEHSSYYIYSISCLKAKNLVTQYKIYSHTFDYDIYLENNIDLSKQDTYKKIVFIDQNLPNNTDFIFNRSSTVSESNYYSEVYSFLKEISQGNKDISINIALHPKTDDFIIKKYFSSFFQAKNKTIQMIKNSDLVITHYSTALNFAYLYNKPILIIYTDEMKKKKFYKNFLLPCAEQIGQEPYNISKNKNLNLENYLNNYSISYSNYINNYIKHPLSENINSWKILSDFILKNNL